MAETRLDAIIIGGGPAGLSAALVLGRARRDVLVLDEGKPRNRVTKESHGFLTRDGISPMELRRIGLEQLAPYPSVRVLEGRAAEAAGDNGRFRVVTQDGETYEARKLIFATGKKDLPLEVPGLQEIYGRSAFVCPFCDGWEMRDRSLAILARGDHAMHMAKLLAAWTPQRTVLTNGEGGLDEAQIAELEAHGVAVRTGTIRRLHARDGMLERVEWTDGASEPFGGMIFASQLAAGSDLPQRLGCRADETGTVEANEMGQTSVPGVYCAGDAMTARYQIVHAAAFGSSAGAAVVGELMMEAWNGRD
ncbi:NAD(P)/FAD-dependent oxidoreductase [Paenibacillus albicereus]|uniref:NAD(P)/FAD-dependent oxidoreductase n=1 Tax=Paenibacillus albicereus TaxID=2726185 RepID=A0A6H2GVP8_9BACL|nr:NAD(P)/FAD-dependent oxidoreductase [Paenibacillus albicereus]QJC51490.1 NAD(P)/FAD-dependent oxidoreductase [Paenibacillus albicereus]